MPDHTRTAVVLQSISPGMAGSSGRATQSSKEDCWDLDVKQAYFACECTRVRGVLYGVWVFRGVLWLHPDMSNMV